MTPAGMKMVELAKKIGTWSAFDAVDALTVPPDLEKALAEAQGGRRGFAAYTPGVKKQCLHYVYDAKRAETRAKRIALIVEAAAAGRKPFEAGAAAKQTRETAKRGNGSNRSEA
jgi:uncharacterized protein YdeI (YjbR/CyaY-like superfamily)